MGCDPWDSLELTKQLGERKFIFLQLGFDDYTTQFKVVGYPPSGEALAFLDMSKTLKKVSNDLFYF